MEQENFNHVDHAKMAEFRAAIAKLEAETVKIKADTKKIQQQSKRYTWLAITTIVLASVAVVLWVMPW
ncbi:MAG: hypothetical protein Q4G42_03215 [Neisseria sp.]|nr:hypothetical protein [Neisseria sp.]